MKCRGCKGTGQRLALLSPDQDLAFAKAGQPIPKVECWYCKGTGFEDPRKEPAVRETDEQ